MRKVWVAVVFVLSACSSSSGSPAAKSSPFTTHYGQDAALLALHIPHCTGAHAMSLGSGDGEATAMPGQVGLATCDILGHSILLYTWKSAATQDRPEKSVFTGQGAYASGTGWTQIMGDDSTAADAKRAIARKVASALGGDVKA